MPINVERECQAGKIIPPPLVSCNTKESSGMDNNCYGIYAPIVITCLSQALLMSIIVNIYLMCMKRHREAAQRIYNLVTEVNCCNKQHATEEEDGQTQEESEAEDIQYAAVHFSNRTRETERQKKEDVVQCGDTGGATGQDGQTQDQTEADVQYAAVNFSNRKKNEKKAALYSDVVNFGWD
ncbi:hypothetical protein KOW79_006994 [Hemibagrus wyckioides]|uniref:Uncharacterized protein n=1 Tax=Hemibagrus wyckioides TaxID=337641 RepID=A0A9D3SMI8_9TELE|nr:hypothetical protein KOW79_006994 [Hemibagrus wyckioides]